MTEDISYIPEPPEIIDVDPEQKKKKKTLWIILAVVAVILLCCCVAAILAMYLGGLPYIEDLIDEFSGLLPYLSLV